MQRLEKVQRQTNERLGRIVDALELQSRHFRRVEDAPRANRCCEPIDTRCHAVDLPHKLMAAA